MGRRERLILAGALAVAAVAAAVAGCENFLAAHGINRKLTTGVAAAVRTRAASVDLKLDIRFSSAGLLVDIVFQFCSVSVWWMRDNR